MMNNKEKKFYIIIFVVVIVYIIATFFLDVDPLSKRITTVTALISAVAFWLQFKRAERLNESSYIMNLNNQFISNKDMTLVEHELELYYNQYEAMINDKSNPDLNVVSKLTLGISQSRTSEQCQKLINYLVYLEALAALVERQVIHLDVIDNLFSYRFFLAVNNPIVQENELLPYSDFYQGIFKLSEYWVKDHQKRKIPIPMDYFRLTKNNLESLKNKRPIAKLEVSNASSMDKKIEIAKCIYKTDEYIYPEAFGEDQNLATKAIARIIGMDDSLMDYRNLIVARYNGEVCGVCIINDGSGKWDVKSIEKRIGFDLLTESLKDGFYYVSNEYFSKQINVEDNMIELVACCVDEGFRRKNVANKMLDYIVNQFHDKPIRLTVLKNNDAAIELYKKHKFKTVESDIDGFAPAGLKKPKCNVMIREPKN